MSRIKYYNGKLDASTVVQLKKIGLEWSEWDHGYEELRECKAQHGDCMVQKRRVQRIKSMDNDEASKL